MAVTRAARAARSGATAAGSRCRCCAIALGVALGFAVALVNASAVGEFTGGMKTLVRACRPRGARTARRLRRERCTASSRATPRSPWRAPSSKSMRASRDATRRCASMASTLSRGGGDAGARGHRRRSSRRAAAGLVFVSRRPPHGSGCSEAARSRAGGRAAIAACSVAGLADAPTRRALCGDGYRGRAGPVRAPAGRCRASTCACGPVRRRQRGAHAHRGGAAPGVAVTRRRTTPRRRRACRARIA